MSTCARAVSWQLILSVALLGMMGADAQIALPGECNNVTVEQDFMPERYLGLWYEHRRFFTFFQVNGICVTATYTDEGDGKVGVSNYQVNSKTGEEDYIVGEAVLNSDSGEGKLLVTFPSVGSPESDYWILDTDYESYSVVWSCTDIGPQTLQTAWVLTRERNPSIDTLASAQAVIEKNGISSDRFTITDQENCPRKP